VHVVSAFATATGLSLLQEVVDAKANEIVAIPDLLARLDLRDATVSIDAMGCQREIAAQIVKQQGNYLLAVKDNQPTLHRDVIAYTEWARDPNPIPADPRPDFTTFTQIDGGHGRIEERTAIALPLSDYISTAKDWKKIAGVGVVESVRTDKLSGVSGAMERRYFIYIDTEMTAEKLLRQAREHWAIENKLHWVLDVAFREDDSRIRAGAAAANLSLVRKLALNLLRGLSLDRRMSLNRKRKACARRPDRVLAAIAAALWRVPPLQRLGRAEPLSSRRGPMSRRTSLAPLPRRRQRTGCLRGRSTAGEPTHAPLPTVRLCGSPGKRGC